MKSILLTTMLALFLTGCTSEKWLAQSCNQTTMSCSEMSFGPFKNLNECVEKMKASSGSFYCAQDCNSDKVCKKTLKFSVEMVNGVHTVVPN